MPDVVIGEPETDKKEGTVSPTEVTEPEPLLLNVVQSVEDKQPLCVPEAVGQPIEPVEVIVPPVKGDEAVIDFT